MPHLFSTVCLDAGHHTVVGYHVQQIVDQHRRCSSWKRFVQLPANSAVGNISLTSQFDRHQLGLAMAGNKESDSITVYRPWSGRPGRKMHFPEFLAGGGVVSIRRLGPRAEELSFALK